MRILDWLLNSVIGGVETSEEIQRDFPDAEWCCHDCGQQYLSEDAEDHGPPELHTYGRSITYDGKAINSD